MAILNRASLQSSITDESGQKVDVQTSSNLLRTDKIDSDILVVKSARKNWVVPKEVIEVTTTITNNTSNNISDMTFFDTIGVDAEFVEGSLKIGSELHTDLNPQTGFTLPVTLQGLGGEMTVTFDLFIAEYPEGAEVKDSSTVGLTLDGKQYEVNSNDLTLKIMNNEIIMTKSADTKAVKSGDIITYTIEITNNGDFKNTELRLTDPIPAGTSFVAESVMIDDVKHMEYNPNDGFGVHDLDVNETIKIEFQVTVE